MNYKIEYTRKGFWKTTHHCFLVDLDYTLDQKLAAIEIHRYEHDMSKIDAIVFSQNKSVSATQPRTFVSSTLKNGSLNHFKQF